MKISRQWLSDYLQFDDVDDATFEQLITTRVAEVDAVHQTALPLEHAVVGVIRSAKAHPSKAHLTLVSISDGSQEFDLVCGAKICRQGAHVAFIAPGGLMCAVQEDGAVGQELVSVESREVAGERSEGVLVSEAELGLSAFHQGIMVLDDGTLSSLQAGSAKSVNHNSIRPGVRLREILGGADTILEIDNKSLTHRPDLWSHLGFARELAAILGRPLSVDPDAWADDRESGAELLKSLGEAPPVYSVEIEPGCGCRRFLALAIENVSSQLAPLWIRRRLRSLGAGSRDLLVDLSNYVMHDIGQPNHAYDADKLDGNTLYIRRARSGEQFEGLDDQTRTLEQSDIVIADAQNALALGGVLGGGPSAVREDTKRLLLESANFDPQVVRRTCREHSLRTDASNRFEKSLSVFSPPLGIQRYVQLLSAIDGQLSLAGGVTDCFLDREKFRAVSVPARFDYIRQRLGEELSDERITSVLESLGFQGDRPSPKEFYVPYYRASGDISIIEDLVEEVGRTVGYESIPEASPLIASLASTRTPLHQAGRWIADFLCARGFHENYQYSFMNAQRACALGYGEAEAVALQNPVDVNYSVLRTSLVPGMVEVLEKNARHESLAAVFELGRTYHQVEEVTEGEPGQASDSSSERSVLCVAYSAGRKDEAHSMALTEPSVEGGAEVYVLRGLAEHIARHFGVGEVACAPLVLEDSAQSFAPAAEFGHMRNWMHPARAGALSIGSVVFGHLAELAPEIIDENSARTALMELDLSLLLEAQQGHVYAFEPVSKFPASYFELSVVMPSRTNYRELEQLLLEKPEREFVQALEVRAVYQGKPLADDQKSVSVRFSLGARDRTLSSEELAGLQKQFVKRVEESKFSLRT